MPTTYRLELPGSGYTGTAKTSDADKEAASKTWRLYEYAGELNLNSPPVEKWPYVAGREWSFAQRADLDARLTVLGFTPSEQVQLHRDCRFWRK